MEMIMQRNGNICRKLSGISSLICNTPYLEIHFTFDGAPRTFYAKAENLNMTGSIKDRMAYYILKMAYERKPLMPGATIIEATSGNTGISFSAIAQAMGHPIIIFYAGMDERRKKEFTERFGRRCQAC